MKAHRIAPGFRSVYAIGPLGEVQVIERGADGLWGRWQETPVRAKGVVNGGGLVATVGLTTGREGHALGLRLGLRLTLR